MSLQSKNLIVCKKIGNPKGFTLCTFTSVCTRSLFYKERSKIMYSPHFWILYSCSLIFTELFVQSFLILKSIFHVFFKKNLLCLQTWLIREICNNIIHFLKVKITICVFFLHLGLYFFLNSIFWLVLFLSAL